MRVLLLPKYIIIKQIPDRWELSPKNLREVRDRCCNPRYEIIGHILYVVLILLIMRLEDLERVIIIFEVMIEDEVVC